VNLERMAVTLRPRSMWEALDLGTAILRRFCAPVYLAWAVCVAPFFVLAYWQLDPWLASLLLWWLLPLFDRVPLYVISRGLFGATPSLPQVLRALPSLWSRHLLPSLVVGRPNPLRSFHLPVQQLEGHTLGGYTRRCKVLNHGNVGGGFLLTTGGWLLGAALFRGTFSLIEVLMPESFPGWKPELLFASPLLLAMTASVLFVTVSIVEPMYVAAGFALYLNRRTELEGWDIELAFRRLRTRLESRSRQRHAAGVGALLLAACLLGGFAPAQEPSRLQPTKEMIREILRDKDFGYDEQVIRWRRIERRESRAGSGTRESGSGSFTPGGIAVGEVLRLMLWVVAAGALVALVSSILVNRGSRPRARVPRASPPDSVAGLDVRPESLPEDLAETAWRRFLAGDAAGCLSLLYRGALAVLIRDHHLEISESSTEGDCLRLVEGVGTEAAPQAGFFASLTRAWTNCAYAHRTPGAAAARQLCEGWAEAFGGAS